MKSVKALLTLVLLIMLLHEHPLHRVEEIAGVNHLFQQANTGFMTEYAKIEETVSPKVLEIIGDWVLKVTAEKQ
ncbi:hypothetical protein KUC3_12750 [Alteromonas sp. KC3]|uniref:hypothetical protein n=1 Tax=unclassified Alteromonas TaxID=2614992 RepID=UPI0019244529|nr:MULTISPECIES: hypothetical protein [unclassified Alteromonas]BCO18418.1 hypothetical protein KUC3_12750 [Alteromonas sp. KC3]BCO22379.1 hypothetical protein KUC14_12480 [Alteromonas sp. KC14]